MKNNEETIECATKSLKEILKKYKATMPSLIEKGVKYGDENQKFSQEEVDQIIENVSSKLWLVCKIGLGKELVEVSNKIVEIESNIGRRLTDEEIKEVIDSVIDKTKMKDNLKILSN